MNEFLLQLKIVISPILGHFRGLYVGYTAVSRVMIG